MKFQIITAYIGFRVRASKSRRFDPQELRGEGVFPKVNIQSPTLNPKSQTLTLNPVGLIIPQTLNP